jgi:tight adherence protein B
MTLARRAPHFLLCIVVATVALVAMSLPGRAAESNGLTITGVDVSAAPEVRLTVAIAGADTRQALDRDAFTLVVSGEERDASLTGVPSDPMQVELVIDTSGSMRGAPLDAAKAAAQSLVDQLPDAVQVGVIGFGSSPYNAAFATADRAATAAAIASLQPSGETAIYDAAVAATSRLALDRRAIVLLTDGRDTASAATLEQAAAALGAARTPFHAVVLQTPESDVAAVQALAVAAGGSVAQAADPAALAGVYAGIAGQLSSTYQLTFRATATGSTGLSVRVDLDGRMLEAETRVSIPVADAPAPAVQAPSVQAADIAPEPSGLQREWAMWAGLASLFAAIAISALIAISRSPQPNQLAALRQRMTTRAGTGTAIQNLAEQATGFAERSLDRSGRRRGLEAALERAGMNMRAGEFLVLVGTAAFAMIALGLLVTNAIFAVLLAAAVVFGTRGLLTVLADRRRRKFGDQLEQTLPLMAGSLRAGFGLMQALDAVARDSEAPTSEEFRRLVVETRLGRDLTDGLEAMAERVGSEDFSWVVEAIEIHRQVGGDLAEVLDNVHATLRDRSRLRRRVQALSGEGKLSAIILFVLPLAMLLYIATVNPDYLGELTGRTLGMAMLIGGGALMVVGGLWMRRIIRLVF